MGPDTSASNARALSLVGDGYIYGATGWVCSERRRQQQAAQYPAHAANILGIGAKWDGKVCWDCAQLTRTVAKAAGITLPSGATSQWRSKAWKTKGTIADLPKNSPAFLYRQSNGAMQHTGYALGDGTFVHAKGTAYGVLHEPLTRYAWTHWASPWDSEQQPSVVLHQATVVAKRGSTVRVRAEPGGKVLGALSLGTVVDVYATSSGWCQIGYQGGKAYMMSTFLEN